MWTGSCGYRRAVWAVSSGTRCPSRLALDLEGPGVWRPRRSRRGDQMDRQQLVEKYNRTKLARETMGMRIAKEFKDGDYVNLGRGLPVLAADYIDPSIDIYYHGEPGIMGYGTGVGIDEWEQIDPNLHDAAIRHVRPKPGMVFFDMG